MLIFLRPGRVAQALFVVLSLTLSTGIEVASAAPYSTEVLRDQPAGYWRLGDLLQSSVAADAVLGGHNGVHGSRTQLGYAPGAITNDSDLAVGVAPGSGTSDQNWQNHTYVPHTAALNPVSGELTLEQWIVPQGLASGSTKAEILAKGVDYSGVGSYSSGYASVFTPVTGGWNIGLRVVTGTSGSIKRLNTTAPLPYDGKWHHVVMTWKASTCTGKVYVDAVELASSTSMCGALKPSTLPLVFGRGTSSPYQEWHGHLDEVAIYGTALSPARIAAHYELSKDIDGDALPDTWETNGVDSDGDGDIDLPLHLMGANPNHKDVFVELDYMYEAPTETTDARDFRLSDAAIETVVNSFAAAPLSNPDNVDGITLHVDNGPNSLMYMNHPPSGPPARVEWGAYTDQDRLAYQEVLGDVAGGEYDWAEFDALRQERSEREMVFHYAVSADRMDDASDHSGVSRGSSGYQPASDFLMSLGYLCAPAGFCPASEGRQTGTFMHELGHNLGLSHGGDDGLNFKPNYPSVMNYQFQFIGLLGPLGYDYSRYDQTDGLEALNESALDEYDGFGLGLPASLTSHQTMSACIVGPSLESWVDDTWAYPYFGAEVDFDCSGTSSLMGATAVTKDINADGALSTLTPFDDWEAVVFHGGAIAGYGTGSGAEPLTPPSKTEFEEAPISTLTAAANTVIPPPSIDRVGIRGNGTVLTVWVNPNGTATDVRVEASIGDRRGSPQRVHGGRSQKLTFRIRRDQLYSGALRVRAENFHHSVISPELRIEAR